MPKQKNIHGNYFALDEFASMNNIKLSQLISTFSMSSDIRLVTDGNCLLE